MTKTPGYTGVKWRSILDREEYPRFQKKFISKLKGSPYCELCSTDPCLLWKLNDENSNIFVGIYSVNMVIIILLFFEI